MNIIRTASLGSKFTGSYEKKECKELSFYIFLTQVASCEFVRESQTFELSDNTSTYI